MKTIPPESTTVAPLLRLALRAVAAAGRRDGVNVLAAGRFVRPLAPGLQRLPRRRRRDEGVAAAADQVGPPRLLQGLADLEVVLRLEELHQRPLHLAVPQAAGD